jgi:ribulose-bisphosphate carboxylase small chain
MFDLRDPAGVMAEVVACREAHPNTYVRLNAFDSTRGFETTRLSFIVSRPSEEPGFRLQRHELDGRRIQYTLDSYAARAPEGRRYGREPGPTR